MVVKRRRSEAEADAPADRIRFGDRRLLRRRRPGKAPGCRKLQRRIIADRQESKRRYRLPGSTGERDSSDDRGTVGFEIRPVRELQLQFDAQRRHLQARRIERPRSFQYRSRVLVVALLGQ